jgi:hypothetical protein
MRVSKLFLFAAICASLLSACALPSALHAASDQGSPCPSLEGYPDCQNGQRLDPAWLAPADNIKNSSLRATVGGSSPVGE